MALTINNITDDSPITVTGGLAGPTLPASTYGAVGSVLSTSLTGNLMWDNSIGATPYSYSPYGFSEDTITVSATTVSATNHRTLHVDGDAEITGDLKLNGVNLSERLDKIEERLGILRPNNHLEDKWEKLKALGEEYRKLEKEILEGEAIWDTLKK